MRAPKYDQPPLDPAFAQMMRETQQQDVDAIDADISRETNSLTARYGALTSGDTAALLARYGTRLALANSTSGSPLLSKVGG